MIRILTLIAFAAVLAAKNSVLAQTLGDTDVPQDTAIVELTLPEGASFKINNQQYRASVAGEKRVLPFRPFQPGRSVPYQLEVQFSDGSITRKTLALRGGERVRVPILAPNMQRPEFVLQTGFPSSVVSAAFSADGNSVVLGSCELTFALYDVTTGRQLRRFTPQTQRSCTLNVSLAVSQDGRYLLTESWSEGAILWDIESGERVRSFPAGHGPMAFSPDGMRLALLQPLEEAERPTSEHEIVIWNTGSVNTKLALRGHSGVVNAIDFSPDNRLLLTGSQNKTAVVWDLDTGQRKIVLVGHRGPVTSVAYSPDGRQILSGSGDGTVILWEASTGIQLMKFEAQPATDGKIFAGRNVAAFCRDGCRIVTTGAGGTAILWNAETGEKLRTFEFGPLVAISPDARRILTRADVDSLWDLTVWELESGRKLRTFSTKADTLLPIGFRPDGKRLLSAASGGDGIVWNLESGTRQAVIAGRDVHFSQDGRRVLTRPVLDATSATETEQHNDTPVTLSDAESGTILKIVSGIQGLDGVRISDTVMKLDKYLAGFTTPQGSRFLIRNAAGKDSSVWDVDSGVETVFQDSDPVFSPDGQRFVSSVNRTASKIRRWGNQPTSNDHIVKIGWWNHNTQPVFSIDGQLLVARETSGSIAVWDSDSGTRLRAFSASTTTERWSFSPDKQRLTATDTEQNTVRLWDVNTGVELRKWPGHSATFGPDGRQMMTTDHDPVASSGNQDPGTKIWDIGSGVMLQEIPRSQGVSFSPNSRLVVTESEHWSAEFWDVVTGDKLCELLSLNDAKDWLVFTPEGLFDGSEGGRQHVAFRVGGGLNVVPVDQFFSDFYTPGLLARISNGERPMPTIELGHELPPKVRIVSPQHGGVIEEPSVALIIEATDQGGGVTGPWIRHNGARLLAVGQVEQIGSTIRKSLEVQLVEGENRIEIEAATNNEFAAMESTRAVLALRYEKPLHKPHLHVLAIGNNYADPSLRLRFARQDAEAIGNLFQQRGQALYEKVHLHLLLDEQVTKQAIQDLLTRKDGPGTTIANTARPQDSLLVLFGGHGTIVGQRYFFIPHSFKREAADMETDIKNQGLAADVLGDWLTSVPCLKRMLIFDTCASGAAVDLVRTSRNPFALRGVIERLNRTQGVFTIAASAATNEAQEVSELGHGVLTYTLLAGLGAVDHGPLKDQQIKSRGQEGVVSVMDWFGYADGHVPELMKMYFGQTQDIQFSGQGTSFPVLTLEDPVQKEQDSN